MVKEKYKSFLFTSAVGDYCAFLHAFIAEKMINGLFKSRFSSEFHNSIDGAAVQFFSFSPGNVFAFVAASLNCCVIHSMISRLWMRKCFCKYTPKIICSKVIKSLTITEIQEDFEFSRLKRAMFSNVRGHKTLVNFVFLFTVVFFASEAFYFSTMLVLLARLEDPFTLRTELPLLARFPLLVYFEALFRSEVKPAVVAGNCLAVAGVVASPGAVAIAARATKWAAMSFIVQNDPVAVFAELFCDDE